MVFPFVVCFFFSLWHNDVNGCKVAAWAFFYGIRIKSFFRQFEFVSIFAVMQYGRIISALHCRQFHIMGTWIIFFAWYTQKVVCGIDIRLHSFFLLCGETLHSIYICFCFFALGGVHFCAHIFRFSLPREYVVFHRRVEFL